MSTFAEDIEAVAGDEEIEAVVIARHAGVWPTGGADDDPTQVVLSWSEVRQRLDYRYDKGFGGADCHPVWAWTASRVIFVGEYDGATWIAWVPRNPQPGEPHLSGQT